METWQWSLTLIVVALGFYAVIDKLRRIHEQIGIGNELLNSLRLALEKPDVERPRHEWNV